MGGRVARVSRSRGKGIPTGQAFKEGRTISLSVRGGTLLGLGLVDLPPSATIKMEGAGVLNPEA